VKPTVGAKGLHKPWDSSNHKNRKRPISTETQLNSLF